MTGRGRENGIVARMVGLVFHFSDLVIEESVRLKTGKKVYDNLRLFLAVVRLLLLGFYHKVIAMSCFDRFHFNLVWRFLSRSIKALVCPSLLSIERLFFYRSLLKTRLHRIRRNGGKIPE